jgi:CRISPR-associated protein Csd2
MSNEPIKNRYDFILIFDVKDGNPNGDPDAGNLPRMDPETGMGLVTDVCLKRKVRNYVQLTQNMASPFDIFVKEKGILNQSIDGAYKSLGIDLDAAPKDEKDGKKRNTKGEGQGSEVAQARDKMCSQYYDIRSFGAVMSTGANAGQVRGPVQMTFGRSRDPIVVLEHSITRMAVATEAEAEKQSGDNRTMGRKNTVPYGLYVSHGFISAHLAAQTGFSGDDLALLWEALAGGMFEVDRSAARGEMGTVRLIALEHASPLGNAPAQALFGLLGAKKKNAAEDAMPPRDSSDYAITFEGQPLPPANVDETREIAAYPGVKARFFPVCWRRA